MPDWFNKLQNVINSCQETEEQAVDQQPDVACEEWMILSDRLQPFENVTVDSNIEVDWHQDRSRYTDAQIGEMPSWIKSKKEMLADVLFHEHEVSDIDSLNEMQKLAYNIVKSHFEDNSVDKDPLCLIVVGVGGTGKSYLINAMRNLLQAKCAVTATTGKAAFNIRGTTLHSLLRLPVGSRGQSVLKGQTLSRFQQSLHHIDYIIIDEYSMLGQNSFGWVDKRCKQATARTDQVFGGKSLILVGDPGQLPPVADKPLYHPQPSNGVAEQGYQVYRMFDNVVKLTINERVQGTDLKQKQFRELLLRLRKGDSTETDWKFLLSRQPTNVPNIADFGDAIRLFYSNEEVAEYNYKKLRELQQPIATINAQHSSAVAKNMSSDDMSGLKTVIFLAKGAKVMLTMNLWPSVGLCNGATGRVVDFIYETNSRPPLLPIAVIVQFDNYRGPSLSDEYPSYVPICPITISCLSENSVHERQQLPLKLAWALTIHKSQGLTLVKAWINIGKTERTSGITYVAISRMRNPVSFVIEPMTLERLTSIRSSLAMKLKLKEEARLDILAKQTHSTFCAKYISF